MVTEAPAIKALAPWFGGKRNLAPDIIEAIGPHTAYWEPFCGSMAVLIAKPVCTMETVNDLHGDLVNVAKVIQHPWDGPRLYRRLRRVVLSRDQHAESAEVIRSHEFTPGIERAFHYFISSWFGRNGVAGTSSYNAGFCQRFTKNGGHAAKRFASAVDSIPAWRRRMRNVTVLNHDGFELLERIEDASKVAIYCDPPYVEKGAKYVHDFDAVDHARLRDLLTRFKKTRVVVSYYDCDAVRDLYDGWSFRSLDVTKAMVNQGMRDKSGSTKAPEVLIVNETPGLF